MLLVSVLARRLIVSGWVVSVGWITRVMESQCPVGSPVIYRLHLFRSELPLLGDALCYWVGGQHRIRTTEHS